MFSGLKYIFGYADGIDASTASASNASDNSNESVSNTKQQSSETLSVEQQETINNSGSTLLEQTLNAATTKLTEQLLPPQASIEQLQSSSQHLLPSITEQHEDKLKRSIEIQDCSTKDFDDDEEDCIEVESWEMLDLVDMAEDRNQIDCGVNPTVQLDESSFEICKATTSGILKTSNNNIKVLTNVQQQVRQKPKVSFDTPDLVSSDNKQNKTIEQEKQIEVPKAAHGGKSKVNGRKKKQNQRIQVDSVKGIEQKVDIKREKKLSCEQKWGNGNGSDSSDICPARIPSTAAAESVIVSVKQDGDIQAVSPQSAAKTVPVLNYAAALCKKPVQKNVEKVEKEERVVKPEPECSTSCSKKRIRALSTSSWSSSDELWPETLEKSTSMMDESCFAVNELDENESIVSSGFSDCDYGYEGINDYYLRAKKGRSKRARNSSSISSSNPSSLVAPMSKRNSDKPRCVTSSIKVIVPVKEQKSMDPAQVKPLKVSLVKSSTRPKKKKISLALPSSSRDFLKKVAASKQVGQDNVSHACEPAVMASSNDSSDIAEMDESWYVTPPPCFTGANKSAGRKIMDGQPKAKEAARENELIEHPAIPLSSKPVPIADKGIQQSKKESKNKSESPVPSSKIKMNDDSTWDIDDDKSDLAMDEAVWIQAGKHAHFKQLKYQRVNAACGRQDFKEPKSKSQTNRISLSIVENAKKQQSKPSSSVGHIRVFESRKAAWKNKFKVDDWDFDDREDADSDFDNMFEPVKKKKVTSGARKQLRKHQQVQKSSQVVKEDSDLSEADLESDVLVEELESSPDPGCKSDCEAELISMRSSSSFDSPIEDKENQIVPAVAERRPPTQVRPIEPERRPGWQLKRQRSKRRPLVGQSNAVASIGTKRGIIRQKQPVETKRENGAASSESSARSTPTLIDRISSSIVANINNLTSGLVSSGTLHSASGAPIVADESSRTLPAGRSATCSQLDTENYNLMARKRISKSYLKRQNICVKQANSNRRPDRRLKMFATPNGCSINRKVQSNFH